MLTACIIREKEISEPRLSQYQPQPRGKNNKKWKGGVWLMISAHAPNDLKENDSYYEKNPVI